VYSVCNYNTFCALYDSLHGLILGERENELEEFKLPSTTAKTRMFMHIPFLYRKLVV